MPQIKGVLSNEERHLQMGEAIKHFPMLQKRGHFSSRWVSIVGYGPSLKDTWTQIKTPMITVSGAHDFMVSRGVIPDWHVDCDPLPHKIDMLTPHNGVKYLMASVCHPKAWEKLKGHNVRLWHLINGDDLHTPSWVSKNHPDGLLSMIGGGSTAGMRAMNVAAALGFRRFHLYGMDCTHGHAGEHLGKKQDEMKVYVGHREFRTSPQMLQQAREMENFIQTMDADVIVHGDGLLQAAVTYRKAA